MNTSGKTVLLFFIIVAACFIVVPVLNPFAASNALETIVMITALTALVSFLFGPLTGDYSWTDRLWSIAPVGYAWIYAASAAFSPLATLGAILVTLWGVRLTFNFARRGGYVGGEDYRWPILRERIGNPVVWQLFNLAFIAIFQQALWVCFTLPLYVIATRSPADIPAGSVVGAFLMLAFLTLETVADHQQYVFQQSKRNLLPRQAGMHEDYTRGFRTTGLFSQSRHPNYLGELGVWWSLYIIGASAAGSLLHWSIIGPALLTALFIGSTVFTEEISLGKYPEYREYRKRTWPIIPKPRRKH